MTLIDKDQILQHHKKLFKVVQWFIDVGYITDADIKDYVEHGFFPQHVHKNRDGHMAAVTMLIEALCVAVGRMSGRSKTEEKPTQPTQAGPAQAVTVEEPLQDAPPEFPLDSVTPMDGLPEFAKGKVTPREDPKPAHVSS